MSRARLAFLVVLGLAVLPSLTLFSAASAEESASVVVEVASSLAYLDEEALRKAIGAELRTRALPPGAQASGARGTLLLGLDRVSGELVMTYRARGGGLLVRNLKLPTERGAQITTIALLAGNLARDEAAELLAAMKPAPGASSGPASSAPASSSGAVSASALLSSSGSASSSAPPPPTPSGSTSASAPAPAPAPAPPSASASLSPSPVPACARRHERGEPLSLQLVPGVGYPFTTEPYHTRLSFSLLLGSVGEVRQGAQLGALLVRTSGDASWVSAGGIGSMVEGRIEGAALGGVFQLGGCDAQGALGAGVFSAQRGALKGVQMAGAVALAGAEVEGAQVAGTVSAARGKVTGFQVSGLVNLAPGGVEGVQVAGLVNTAGDVEGVQVAPVNIAGRIHGVQLGLINLAKHMDGLPIGLFSLAGNTKLQPLMWVTGHPRFNLGLKMTTGMAYQIISSGVSKGEERPLYGLGYTLGLHVPRGDFFLDMDIGYHQIFPTLHLDTSDDSPRWKDDHAHLVKVRVLGGVQLWKRLALFAGVGAVITMDELAREKEPQVRQEWTFGVQF